MFKKIASLLTIAVVCMLGGYSCNDSKQSHPDVKGIDVIIKSVRLDKELYSIDTAHIAAGLKMLSEKYPDFMNFYLDTVMGYGVNGNFTDTNRAIREGVREVLTYKDFRNLQDTINKYYPDTKDVDDELAEGFRYMKHYFPSSTVPRIFYINDILRNRASFIVDSNTACISLDMFVGPQFPYYASVGIPAYLASHQRRSYIPVSLFSSIYETSYKLYSDDATLLDLMIQKGKEQYFLHKILPEMHDSVLFGFTNTQVEWCSKNEAFLYNYFIEQKLFFEKEIRKIAPYVTDGPFAHGIGTAADPGHPTPGNIGSWVGYKIVRSYMEQYPQTALKDLLARHSEPTRFLDSAKYKPR